MPAPRFVTWEDLPDSIRQMDPDERETFLMRNGSMLIPRGVAPPPNAILGAPSDKERNLDVSGTDVMGFGPGLTHPENRKNMAKAGAAAASTLAGGGGPMGAIVSGALNAKFGPDVNSGRGIAENVANVAFGRLNPIVGPMLNKGSSIAQGAKNFLAGAGQVGATQAAGTALEGEEQSIGDTLAAGTVGGLGTAAGNRFLQAVQKSTPIVRQKLQPFLEKLQATEAVVPPQAPVAPPKPMPVAGTPTPDTADPLTQKIRQLVDYVEKQRPDMYGVDNPAVSARSSQNDDLEEQLRKSLIAAGKDPASLPPPTMKPPSVAPEPPKPLVAAAAPKPDSLEAALGAGLADDVRAEVMTKAKTTLGGIDPDIYITDVLSGKQPLDTLPQKLDEMDAVLPEFRTKLKTKIVETILSGVGESGAFGDLTPLQRLQAFGKQKFGDRTGAQVINKIFDGSAEAYRNLNDMQEIIEASGRGSKDGSWHNKLRVYWNNASPVVGLGGGSLLMYVPVLSVAGKAAVVGGAVKALTLTADAVAEYLGKKNSKWADVLYDMATGGNRYSAQSISNVISGLRRRATEERDLSQGEYEAEVGGR